MERWADDDGVQALFEIFTTSQRLILKSMDYQGVRFTKYQIYLLIVLSRKKSMTMSQAAASLGCSKEQATRLVAALVAAQRRKPETGDDPLNKRRHSICLLGKNDGSGKIKNGFRLL